MTLKDRREMQVDVLIPKYTNIVTDIREIINRY